MKPLVLCILDGVGISDNVKGNAVYKADMPNFKRLLNEYPNCLLTASGSKVGLPDGQMGNSEVGHTNIGAGRIVYQPLELINHKIETKEFFDNKNILDIIEHTKTNNSKLHIMGLLSDGGIHSYINHLFALLDMCKQQDVKEVYLHLFLDGRDTLPSVGLKYLNELNDKINKIGLGKICTISGRYYAMDRDNNYVRVEKAYDVIVNGNGEEYGSYEEAICANQEKNITDEFTIPCVINKEGLVEDNDGIIIFNFRPDRLRELGSALTNPNFNSFPHKNFNNVKLLTMMPVSNEVINTTAYDLEVLNNTFGEYISSNGLSQLRIAETEKYAHVTYFFDGGVEKRLKNCKRTLIASPKVPTYDMTPGMSAKKITTSLLHQLPKYDVVILNFANGDMVGHTGNYDAAIKGLEVVDECLGKIIKKVDELGGTLIVTADHGNCECMIDENNNKLTSHTTNPVPFVITRNDISLKNGKLADIAPTMLKLLELPIPEEMTGEVLIKSDEEQEHNSSLGKIFRIVSIIFLGLLFCTYSYRFIHYYRESHTIEKYKETNIITKLDDTEVKLTGSGLYVDGDTKYFKGLVDNNYLYYEGITWRIISYSSNEVKLISDESLTSLPYSKIDEWVNHLKEQYKDDDYIKDITLLSSDDYNKTFLGDSYLNNDTYWYTSDNKYINADGKVVDELKNIYSVRVVISLDNTANIINGNGTISNNYIIKKDEPIKGSDLSIGSYVKFSNKLWRVIANNSSGTELALEDLLDAHIYSKNKETFNMDDKDSLAYYLNNDFFNELDTKSVRLAKWNVIQYNKTYEVKSIIEANVGLLNIGDLFINDFTGYVLMTEENDNTIYKVNPKGLLYLDFKSSSRKVRPVIYVDGELLIKEGSGYKNSPYVLGE